MARALMSALNLAGYSPRLAADLRTRDGKGETSAQIALEAEADALLPSLIAEGRRAGWAFWLTYHNYYKAPDLLGPHVARALNIPYLQVESTRARKRFGGAWDRFAHHAEAAADAAQAIFHLTTRDAEALHKFARPGQQIIHLPPFLPRRTLPPKATGQGDILVAGMMRAGDKMESYRLVAQTFAHLRGTWHAEIAGDGPLRADVEALMAPFAEHVRFLGALDAAGMQAAYDRARLLFWPGVNEAFGLVYLEAQAAGLPVAAQDRPGVCDVLPPDLVFPKPEEGPAVLARTVQALRSTPPDPTSLRDRIERDHLLPTAVQCLQQTLEPML